MSKRSIKRKQANKLRKAFRRQLPRSLDLRHWLKSHGYADTTGQADAIILARRVKSESHVLGVVKGLQPKPQTHLKVALGRELVEDDFERVDVVNPLVPAKLRSTLTVVA